MNKSELFENIAKKKNNISIKIVEKIIKTMLTHMVLALSLKRRIEIRGFGSFSLRYRKSRFGRNPKNGNVVQLQEKYIPHFKPGKKLKNRINILKKQVIKNI